MSFNLQAPEQVPGRNLTKRTMIQTKRLRVIIWNIQSARP
jgi:hypothetical protein